jgi:hypothetical protein
MAQRSGTSLATRLLIEANPGRAADLAKIDELVLQQHTDRCARLESAQALDSIAAEIRREIFDGRLDQVFGARVTHQLYSVAAELRRSR